MTEAGEVYYDDVFDSEVTIISVGSDTVKVNDRIGGNGVRELRREIDWEHNISVGRYQKIAETEVEEMEAEEEVKESIFDF